MSASVSVSGRTFIPTSSSPSSKGVEVEVDPEYSVGVELGAEVAAIARELEPEPEPVPDPDTDAEPDPNGKPCILSSPSTSSLREEEPTAEDCDWRRSGIQGRWWWGDIVESSGRRIQDLEVSSPSSKSR
jgi:hypothetical protein